VQKDWLIKQKVKVMQVLAFDSVGWVSGGVSSL